LTSLLDSGAKRHFGGLAPKHVPGDAPWQAFGYPRSIYRNMKPRIIPVIQGLVCSEA